MSVSVRIDTGNLVRLVSRAIAGQAVRKDRAGVVTTGPVSTEIPPCSKEFTDANEF
jgi:hypothetical protein